MRGLWKVKDKEILMSQEIHREEFPEKFRLVVSKGHVKKYRERPDEYFSVLEVKKVLEEEQDGVVEYWDGKMKEILDLAYYGSTCGNGEEACNAIMKVCRGIMESREGFTK